jgi:hypothetical protein
MSKVVGFIVGAALIVAGVLTGNVALIIQGSAMIVTQAVVDLTMPKQPARQASEMEIQLGEVTRSAFLGEGFTAGSLVDGLDYGGKYGTDWEVLVIRLADHKCDSLTGFYVNDEFNAYTGDGNVAAYNGEHYEHLHIYFRADTTTTPLPAIVTANGPGWTAADIGAGGCDVIVAYRCDTPTRKTRFGRAAALASGSCSRASSVTTRARIRRLPVGRAATAGMTHRPGSGRKIRRYAATIGRAGSTPTTRSATPARCSSGAG